MPAETTEFFVV